MKSHANQHTGSSGTTAIVWRRATHRSSADRGSEGHPLSSRDAHHARPATSLKMRGQRGPVSAKIERFCSARKSRQ